MGTKLSHFAESIFKRTYAFTPDETWDECAARVAKAVAMNDRQEKNFFEIIKNRIFIPGGRYLYGAGRPIYQPQNCFGLVAKDSREGWAQLVYDSTVILSMGGGVGINFSDVRPSGSPISRMGGTASGPISLMSMVTEIARHVMSGGKRRSALWFGLDWRHKDIEKFIDIKDWDNDIRIMKSKKFEYPAPLDMANISVIMGDEYLSALSQKDSHTLKLHNKICERMLRTGEPAFFNISNRQRHDPEAVSSNACVETNLHEYDSCNIGSIVLPRIRDISHMEEVVRTAIRFLYNGSIIANHPLEAIRKVVEKNRRIGLGLMGLHEFMLINGYKYEWFPKLESYLKIWEEASDDEAIKYADSLGLARPIARRAVAPTGTISIVSEVSSGIEPIFCLAYKRRYVDAGQYKFQYVVDPTAKKLIQNGIPVKDIEDAYSLSYDVRRRLEVNAKVQEYTDQSISSTINLPAFEEQAINVSEFSDLMIEYLPRLNGITTYPNNSRSGQPLVPCDITEAIDQEGVIFEETGECSTGVCGL